MNKTEQWDIEQARKMFKTCPVSKKGRLIVDGDKILPEFESKVIKPILEKSEGKNKRGNEEYKICKEISLYLQSKYPNIIYHWDLAGLNLSRTQAGMMKSIQGLRGFPDLCIAENNGDYCGIFIEIKKESPYKSNGEIKASSKDHLKEQERCINRLKEKGYYSCFAWSFEQVKELIDNYLEQ
jgi:hypothetical protein